MTKRQQIIYDKMRNKRYYDARKDAMRMRSRIYGAAHREERNAYRRKYTKNNKEKVKLTFKIYRQTHKGQIKKYKQSEKGKISSKKYRVKHKEQIKISAKIYRDAHRKEMNTYIKKRIKSDPIFRLNKNVRRAILHAFKNKGYVKNSKAAQILGCSFEAFKTHIETQFEDWMNWDNYGLYNGTKNFGWDLDHIIPVSSAKTEEDIIKLNHYINFQPLCSYVNRYVKKNNLIKGGAVFQPVYLGKRNDADMTDATMKQIIYKKTA